MNAEFPWVFVSYWGLLGIAFIYFIDGLIDYKVRSNKYIADTFRNHFVISLLIGKNRESSKSTPSSFYVVALLVPGAISFLVSILFLPHLPKVLAGIFLAILFILTWLFSSRISQDFLSGIFLSFAFGVSVLVVIRLALIKQAIAIGLEPSLFLTLFLVLSFYMFSIYFTYFLPKFMPNYKWKPIKVWVWEYLVQMTLILIWFFGLLDALFPRELFR